MSGILSLIWLLPAAGGVLCALLPRRLTRVAAILVAAGELVLTLIVAYSFDSSHHGYQFVEQATWVPQFNVGYHLGVDGLSVWLLVLNALIALVAVLATPARTARLSSFLGLMLLMEAGMAGVFEALDLVLFYVFWEGMLIPAYFLLWLWGEGDRPWYAALKFVLYTLAGSLLMLVGVIGEYAFSGAHTFDIATLAAHQPSPAIQFGLFFLFAIAFVVKVPVFPFHSWLPDAYLAAPTPFLLMFAGVMGKTGAYAMLRILLPLNPQPEGWWNWNAVLPVLAVLGIIWGALLALAQRDIKAVVAYSSISHMGFIVLGIFAFNAQGQQGAVLQMLNHGIIIPALFLLVAGIQARTGTRDREVLSDLAPRMPVMAGVFLIVTMAALGLPGLNSFVGEFMTLLGAWQFSPWLAVAGAIGLVLAPVYMLRLFQGLMYSRTQPAHAPEPVTKRTDIARGELALLAPLVALMFLLGLYPYLITQFLPALGQGMQVLGSRWS
ncbi:MAG TPA: NADH-quinone oxidoreductase subunit M [Candidatus Dormibacteraeota bacterium]